MKIDSYVNKFLAKFWPEDARGNREVYLHSQNLNDGRDGEPDGLPWEGRLWFHMGRQRTLAFSWHMPSHFCSVSVGPDREDRGLKLHWAFPPVAFWLTLPVLTRFLSKSEYQRFGFEFFDVRVHDWTLWWQFFEGADWSSSTPKWKNGNWNFQDFFLGKVTYKEGEGLTEPVVIPMPEGPYEATVKMSFDSWSRPRWFTKVLRRADVKVPQGIPHEGKGENSYDCGEDRLFGVSGPAASIEDAIAMVVSSALESRRKYNGSVMAKYPHPSLQVKPPPQPPPEPGENADVEAGT